MILDTSAVVAIVFREPDYETFIEKLGQADQAGIGVPTLCEATIVLSARMKRDARAVAARFLMEGSISLIPFTEGHYSTAVDAWLRYGKGRHRANLNFGDCLAYATAKVAGESLLCKGRDFSLTDLVIA
jgi:ribonuclease VapC